jgi:hypothetical protein
MHPIFVKMIVYSVIASVFVGGWATGHWVTPPKAVPQSEADNVVKYCTRIGTGNSNDIPAPFNQFVPKLYQNGTYALYSCKLN